MQKNSEVSSRLVIGHKRDGRCQYDSQAKLDLVRQCLKPGVSISRMAMQHSINANLLRTWIAKHQRTAVSVQPPAQTSGQDTGAAFIPLQIESAAPPPKPGEPGCSAQALRGVATAPPLRLHVQLPNGVNLEIDAARPDALMPIMQLLSTLPCSN